MFRKIALGAIVICAVGAQATQITVGSYNVRVKTPSDQGVNSWDQRKDYVARTVIDNGFEIVGFNEVRCGEQYDDLTSRLPGYEFHSWDGETGYDGSATSVNLIAYRSDKFELMDKGWYFLCRDLGGDKPVWEPSWDNSSYTNVRNTSWVKMRVKDSGEIFYLFCTHLDHQGNIARMLQAQINYEKMWEIAGHYPTIMVGDQNSTTTRVNYLNLYNAGFTDSFSIIENPEEKFGKADPPTAGQWNEVNTGRRIDYIWVRGFNVDSYDHCTDTYDLGAMPSDHLAITAKLSFEDYDIHNRYQYVSAGSNGNGTVDAPFGTLEEAVAAARRGDTIYVAAGDYEITKQIEISKSVRIFGGYDDAFTGIVGRSSFKANGEIRCFMLKGASDVEMRNIGVYNANVPATNQDGGGICAHGSRLILRDCELADNSVGRDGGAIDCTKHLILDRVTFRNNKAGRNGGAVCYDNPNKRYWYNFPIEYCLFEGNEAVDGSAIYLPRFLYAYVSGNTFVSNNATNGSTAYIYAFREPEPLGSNLTMMNNTFALNKASGENHASALYVDIEVEAPFALLNNTIVSNTSDAGVAAVYMKQGVPYICNNIIACNDGGDVYLNSTGVTANYNVYTTTSSINYRVATRDIYSSDMAEAVAGLAGVLDGTVVDGKFVPALTLPENVAVSSDALAQEYAWGGVPAIKVVNPKWDSEKSLNSVIAMRMREDVNRADVNNDCMKERSVSLTFDQHGNERPLTGNATIGALEYVAPAGIDGVVADGVAGFDADAPIEYFDLQGRKVQNPSNGIFIRRQGTLVEKVVR